MSKSCTATRLGSNLEPPKRNPACRTVSRASDTGWFMDSALHDSFWGFDGGFLSQLPRSTPSTQGKRPYLTQGSLWDLTVTISNLCPSMLTHNLGILGCLGAFKDKSQPESAEAHSGNVCPHSKDPANLERIESVLSPTTRKTVLVNSFTSDEQAIAWTPIEAATKSDNLHQKMQRLTISLHNYSTWLYETRTHRMHFKRLQAISLYSTGTWAWLRGR